MAFHGKTLTIMKTEQQQLQEMLDEVKRIRESLAELSESAQKVTEAIRGVLGEEKESLEDAYRAIHEDL